MGRWRSLYLADEWFTPYSTSRLGIKVSMRRLFLRTFFIKNPMVVSNPYKLMEKIQPVTNDPNAGTDNPPVEAVASQEIATQDSTQLSVIADALAVIQESDKALADAERKIVSQKRKLKGQDEPEDIDARVEEAVRRVLEERQPVEDDKETQAIQKQRAELAAKAQRLREAETALKAKLAISSGGEGQNQDKLRPKEDLSKTLNEEQLALYQKLADDRGLPLDTVLREKAVHGDGIELIRQLNKLRK